MSRETPTICVPALRNAGGQIAEILRLARAAGGHVLRVEVDHQLLACGVLQAPGAAARHGQRKVRHLGASVDRGHLASGFHRFEDGIEVERVAELHELLAQVRDVDAARHVDDHLHGEHRRAGVRGRVAARGDFRDVDAAAWRKSPTGPTRCRSGRGTRHRSSTAACPCARVRGSVRFRWMLRPLVSARRLSSVSSFASACQLPDTSSSIANSVPRLAMRLSLMLPPHSLMTRVSS